MFECKFKVSSQSKHICKHTHAHVQCIHAIVGAHSGSPQQWIIPVLLNTNKLFLLEVSEGKAQMDEMVKKHFDLVIQ